MTDAITESGTPGETNQGSSKRRAFVAIGIGVFVAVVVFGVILPQLVDWKVVFDVIKTVSPVDLLLIFGLGVIRYFPAGWIYALVLPGLSVANGTRAWVASSGIGSTLPGFDLVVRVSMYRSWGFPLERSMSGMFLSGIVEMSTKLLLAITAVLLWGLVSADLDALTIAAIAIVVLAALGLLVVGILRSEARARSFGHTVQRIARWVLVKFQRQAPEDLVDRILAVRIEAREVLGKRWPQAFLGAVIGQVLIYTILLLSIRAVGIDESTLSWTDVLLAYGITTLITAIPITPGGVGIASLSFVAVFTAIAGRDVASIATAGVLLYRVATWLITIPIGWIVALRWQSKSGVKLFPGGAPGPTD